MVSPVHPSVSIMMLTKKDTTVKIRATAHVAVFLFPRNWTAGMMSAPTSRTIRGAMAV